MKIGILTFHRAINYGAFLQAFALKKYLSSLGNDVEIIDYWPNGHADVYRLFPHSWKNLSFVRKIKFIFSLMLVYSRAKKRRNGMLRLVEDYLGLTAIPCYQTPESLSDISYDCVVYGSDQIWWKSTILGYMGFDPVYWGEYLPNGVRKIAYAPSMGIIELTAQDKDWIRKRLANFDVLSVRESALVHVLSPLIEQNISLVLDPVFLLSSEEWEKFCIPINQSRYILYYNLILSKEADELVETMVKKLQCDVVEITGSVRPIKFGKRYVQTADAVEFVSLVKNATFVITSSFHGTAFALLFKKQFYSIGMGKRAGRVESLLEQLNIGNRLVKKVDEMSLDEIDYDIVQKRMQLLALQSQKYLIDAVRIS